MRHNIKSLNSQNLAIKAQIHAGGRGKAGGIKIVKSKDELRKECSKMLANYKKGQKVEVKILDINIEKERSIDVIITRLRKKIENDPKNPKYLQTMRGEGYVLWIE